MEKIIKRKHVFQHHKYIKFNLFIITFIQSWPDSKS